MLRLLLLSLYLPKLFRDKAFIFRTIWVDVERWVGLGDIQWAKLILTLENSISKWAVQKTKVWGILVYFFFLVSSFSFALFQVPFFFFLKPPGRERYREWLIWGLKRPVTLFLLFIELHHLLVTVPYFGVLWWERFGGCTCLLSRAFDFCFGLRNAFLVVVGVLCWLFLP